jgi:hypothetical protein
VETYLLKRLNRCPEKGDMSVYDVNAALDSLNAATDKYRTRHRPTPVCRCECLPF